MKTQATSFNSIASLQNAQIDFKALRDEGRLQVGDETYKVTVGRDGALVVKDAKAQSFFSLVSTRLSSHKEQPPSQAKNLSQILAQKQSAATQALREVICQRDGGPDVQIDSAVKWAQRCAEPQDARKMYHAYRDDLPGLPPMDEATSQVLYKTLRGLKENYSTKILHQSFDDKEKEFDFDTFLKAQPQAAAQSFYRFQPRHQSPLPANSRLTINVKPEYAADLLKALARLTRDNRHIQEGKIAAPGIFGQRTDAAILYLRGDYAANVKIANSIRKALPEEAFVDHTPGCMHRILPGISYAEHVPGDKSSHGRSRSALVHKALNLKGDKPLAEKLAQTFKEAGYHPHFPAFRLNSFQ